MRWSDMDAYRHVNNTAYLAYLEQARVAMFFDRLRSASPAARSSPATRSTTCARSSTTPSRCGWSCGSSEVRGASFTVRYEVFDGDALAARAVDQLRDVRLRHRPAATAHRRGTRRSCAASPTTPRRPDAEPTPRQLPAPTATALARARAGAAPGGDARPPRARSTRLRLRRRQRHGAGAAAVRRARRPHGRTRPARRHRLDVTVARAGRCSTGSTATGATQPPGPRRRVARPDCRRATGWRRVETVPDDVVRAARPQRRASRSRTPPPARACPAPSRAPRSPTPCSTRSCSPSTRRAATAAEVRLRALSALTRMGFLPRGSHVQRRRRRPLDAGRGRVRHGLPRAARARPAAAPT